MRRTPACSSIRDSIARTQRRAGLLLAFALVLPACGDDDSPQPDPTPDGGAPVEVETIVVDRAGNVLARAGFA